MIQSKHTITHFDQSNREGRKSLMVADDGKVVEAIKNDTYADIDESVGFEVENEW